MVGGWEVADALGKPVAHEEARWFTVSLDRSSAPWAYRRGEPFRVIAALELLGNLLAVKLFIGPSEGEGRWSGKISAKASTDNQGYRFVLCRLMTSEFPLWAFVCELSAVMVVRSCLVDLGGVLRGPIEDADAITSGDVREFCRSKEVQVDLQSLGFLVLDKPLDRGDTFYTEMQAVKEKAMTVVAAHRDKLTWAKRSRKVSLRAADPW